MQMAHPFTEAIAVFEKMALDARAKWRARADRLSFQAIEERDNVLVFCQEAIDALHNAYKAEELSEHNVIMSLYRTYPKYSGDPWGNNPTAH